jgi:hypothetical protein
VVCVPPPRVRVKHLACCGERNVVVTGNIVHGRRGREAEDGAEEVVVLVIAGGVSLGLDSRPCPSHLASDMIARP